jgi:hypothetical protein
MTAVEAQWVEAKQQILGDDPQRRVLGDILAWYQKIEVFRKREDQRMVLHDPSAEDLAVHKSLLERLITDGQHLLSLAGQVGLPKNRDDITAESAAATLELLEADYRGWHKPMPEDQRKRIRTAAFPDVA